MIIVRIVLGVLITLMFLGAGAPHGHAYTVGKTDVPPLQMVRLLGYCKADQETKQPPAIMEALLEMALLRQDKEVVEVLSTPASPCRDIRIDGLPEPIEGVTSTPYKKLYNDTRCYDVWLVSTAKYGWVYGWYVCKDRTNGA